MKKKAFIVLSAVIIILILSNSWGACRHKNSYSFLHRDEEVLHISIVNVSFNSEGELIITEQVRVDDTVSFLNDFRNIHCYTYFGDPTGVINENSTDDAVVRIDYKNGEYELINWNGQSEYTIENGFRFYSGYSVFDEKQYEELILLYLSN